MHYLYSSSCVSYFYISQPLAYSNACMIHLCNCFSFVLNHPLSAGENVSDLSTPYGNKQKIKTIQQFSLGFRRQSSNKNVWQKSIAISALPWRNFHLQMKPPSALQFHCLNAKFPISSNSYIISLATFKKRNVDTFCTLQGEYEEQD